MIGQLGKATLAAATNTTVYTVPAISNGALLDINVVNSTTNDANVKIAVTSNASPAAGDYIENGVLVPSNGGVLERTDLKVSPGEKIIVHSSIASLEVRVSGEVLAD